MPQGSNDLNAFLKAKVVKLQVELDTTNEGLKKARKQINTISEKLSDKPVKLNVKLDYTIKNLTNQLKSLQTTLENSKTLKPLKIDVSIDVKGSATQIKNQLKEVYNVVNDFNQKYGQQLKQMQEQASKASKAGQQIGNINIPMDASVQNFNNIKQYVNQLKEAERILKSKFPDGKGLFSSFEMKDANGNLQSFIATLERADGVVEKIRYKWNQDKNKFEIIDRTTATNTEKVVHKSMQMLQDLEREISKLGEKSREFRNEYNNLMNSGMDGKLTIDAVKEFQTRIKNEQVAQQEALKTNNLLRERERIMRDVINITKGTGTKFDKQVKDILAGARNATTVDDYKQLRLELENLTLKVKEYKNNQKEAEQVDKMRAGVLNELTRLLRITTDEQGILSRENIKYTMSLASNAKTMKDIIAIQQTLIDMNRRQAALKDQSSRINELARLKTVMVEFARVSGENVNKVEEDFNELSQSIGNSLGKIQQKIQEYQRKIRSLKDDRTLEDAQRRVNSVVDSVNHKKIKGLIDEGDITKIKDYLSQTLKLDIATARVVKDANGMTKINAILASTGKTAKQLTFEFDNINNKLRSLGESEIFNRNANLGIFEQLRIAMERVPVWMASMTAFYGSINSIKAMSNELLTLDKQLTELRRVADSSLSIDTLFAGSVQLSKELGNNIHDILDSVAEFARTFGDFNERQLLVITKTATLMSNVSDLTAQEATESLVGTMNAFNITAEQSIHIVDALNEVNISASLYSNVE